jgi:hypothetical protein
VSVVPELDTILNDIKNTLASSITALQLADAANNQTGILNNVYVLNTPDFSNLQMPGVIICSAGEVEETSHNTTEDRAWWLPTWVYIVDSESRRQQDRWDQYAVWRHKLFSSFDLQRMSVTSTLGNNSLTFPWYCACHYRAPIFPMNPPDPRWLLHVRTGLTLRWYYEERRFPGVPWSM